MIYFHFQDRIDSLMHFSGIKGGNNSFYLKEGQKTIELKHRRHTSRAFIKQTPSTIFLFVCTFKKAEKF